MITNTTNQLDTKDLARFLDSPELESLLQNPLPTMLWTADTHHNITAWVRESGRSHRRSTAGAAGRKTTDPGRQSRQLRLRQTLEHQDNLADLSRMVWSEALGKKESQALVPLSVKEAQVISKTNCQSLINLKPVEPSVPELLKRAWSNLVSDCLQAVVILGRTPKSQREG